MFLPRNSAFGFTAFVPLPLAAISGLGRFISNQFSNPESRRCANALRLFAARNRSSKAYLAAMKFEFCLPTRATIVPAAPEWFHEMKYDGYRLRVERDGERVRLITKGGYDWTKRFPWIVEAALKNRQSRFVIDGEAVILGVDGRSDFNALHSEQAERRSSALRFRRAGDGRRGSARPAAIDAQDEP